MFGRAISFDWALDQYCIQSSIVRQFQCAFQSVMRWHLPTEFGLEQGATTLYYEMDLVQQLASVALIGRSTSTVFCQSSQFSKISVDTRPEFNQLVRFSIEDLPKLCLVLFPLLACTLFPKADRDLFGLRLCVALQLPFGG